MSKWLKEPLIHFLLLGGLIFVAFGWFAEKGSDPGEIFISRGQQENLLNTFSRTWQRPPTPQEFQGLLKDYIRQEIAYRESTAMGLDENDIVIRRRLRQKLELLAEDVASLAAPTEQDLQSYLEDNTAEYMVEPRLTLRQIYFSRDRRGPSAEQDATDLLRQLNSEAAEFDPGESGDPLPLPSEIDDLREEEIARLFGSVFTDALSTIEVGRWSGPVESGFGLHLVFIEDRVDAREPALEDVEDAVQRDWLSQRRREAVDGLYERLAENYSIEIESLIQDESSSSP
jgi:hypothetical protein